MRFSQDYVQRVLRSNAAITRLLVRLFESRFDPARQPGAAERCEAIAEEIRGQLDEVVSLDHDRILRSYLALIDATLRTNYYRTHSPGDVAVAGGPGPAAAGGPVGAADQGSRASTVVPLRKLGGILAEAAPSLMMPKLSSMLVLPVADAVSGCLHKSVD